MLKFSSEKIMAIAQQLFEGVGGNHGLITYIRTDSTRISPEARELAAAYITSAYGGEYLNEYPEEGKKGAQDAHEAIRPTDISCTPEIAKNKLNNEQYQLYKLIYIRFLCSQMAPAEYDELNISVAGRNTFKQLIFSKEITSIFELKKQTMVFPGCRLVYLGEDDQLEQDLHFTELKSLQPGTTVEEQEIFYKRHVTEPPQNYTEAALIKQLDKLGIGRPSTYSAIIKNLLSREYTLMNRDKGLEITDLGIEVIEVIQKVFPMLIDYKFTSNLEKELDVIAGGNVPWQNVLESFYLKVKEAKKK